MKTLSDLLQNVHFRWNQAGSLSVTIQRITSDSRKVKAGDLFVALGGAQVNGHQFISEAVQQGASVIVSESSQKAKVPPHISHIEVENSRRVHGQLLARFYQTELERIRLIGVTGTNGKTTTEFVIQVVLNQLVSCGLIGTIRYSWKSHVEDAKNTTPGAEELFSLLTKMVLEGVGHCVMEVSSHGLDQDRTAGLRFCASLFTNLTQDHLDYHKTLENYYSAKRKLFLGHEKPGAALVNLEDPYGRRLASEIGKSAVGYGEHQHAIYRLLSGTCSLNGSEFEFLRKRRKYVVKTNLPFKHNIYNTLACIAALGELGFPPEQVTPLLQDFPGVPGRMERVDEGQPFFVFVDYAHTPDAFSRVLSSARELTEGRIITVFGCGGDRDKTKRPLMGRAASDWSQRVVLTTDNSRSEDPVSIVRDIERGIEPQGSAIVERELDRREAIRKAVEFAHAGDLILILGKGHEKVQVTGKEAVPFDDVQVAREFLRKFSHVYH